MKHKLSSGSKTIILMAQILALSVASGNAQTAQAPPPTVSGKDGKMADGPASPTLTLAPAVVMVKIPAGQSWTRTFQMSNFTPANFRFEIEVQDVVVKDGKRTYAPAGETEGGIAISAVASPREVQIAPQSIGAATVTLTLPAQTSQRGVVIYFRGKTGTPGEDGTVGIGASLGALVTFELSGDYGIMAGDFSVTSQTETSNLTVSHELVNSGREPVLPKGATAILDDAGRRVGKALFPQRRLMPGEKLTFTAENPSQLAPGHYRVISSFEYGGKVVTANGEFSVQ
jgi:hypothetical protein